MSEARTWLFGLTADEWLHLAGEGEESEVSPCCGDLSDIRELLNSLATSQGPDNIGWQLSMGRHVLELVLADGDGHGLLNQETFPLLHRVLDGIHALAAAQREKK